MSTSSKETPTTPPPFESALLVEDEPSLATGLKIALRKIGIRAEHASNLEEARTRFEKLRPDFILLDRMLPDGDGLDFCAQLRSQGYRGTILILTASAQISDRVAGLEGGADDYLPKPFSWEELSARIRALSRRRIFAAAPEPAQAGAKPALWSLDEGRLRVLGPKGWAELTPLEFKLASKLIGARGAILTREDLLKDVWGFSLLPKTRTVDHFLGRLRKRFESDPESPRHFLTVRGAGYRFEA